MVNGIRLSKPVCERPEREERVRWGRGVWGRFDGCQYFVVRIREYMGERETGAHWLGHMGIIVGGRG